MSFHEIAGINTVKGRKETKFSANCMVSLKYRYTIICLKQKKQLTNNPDTVILVYKHNRILS